VIERNRAASRRTASPWQQLQPWIDTSLAPEHPGISL
jgi:hypothetical protein